MKQRLATTMAWATTATEASATRTIAGATLLTLVAGIDLLVYFGLGLPFGCPGFLFLLNAGAAIVCAAGVLARLTLAWVLGALLCNVTVLLFILSRTTGLPGIHYLKDWLVMVGHLPLGPLSLIAELSFAWIAPTAIRLRTRAPVSERKR